MIKAYAVHAAGEKLQPFSYEPGSLDRTEVEIAVEYCGICHSDLSMINNDWGNSQYPLVPGHEVVGTVAAMGEGVTKLELGQRVGLGWFSKSCMQCEWCLSGNHNLCQVDAEQTIVGRHGGFADRVRADEGWVIALPKELPAEKAGPLFCGGITVFNPIIELGIQPTDRVGVIGIGGLGHLAVSFLNYWGCEVTAFSSSPDKEQEARDMGADRFISSRDPEALKAAANSMDVIISTVNVSLEWSVYLAALRPKGKLHFVGVVPEAIPVQAFTLIGAQKSVSGSPLGSPATIEKMLTFAARHGIMPVTEEFAFDQVNEAIAHLEAGKARYRIVLKH
ncbi:MAG: alcohol dehydrogenase [Phormidesmis priestleyi]|uniref:alcohol dehydrogenase (NADP(+)) n=1 Tax=Phormidesmis priestleyi TaxID=268141 RepID=A0A2W4XRK3_9CYAN|nr:MAG: alcohol dehydrogenase [Phormidesmis priestleyi]